ncbi:MAG: sialate O-acetylesterase, partial [Pseudomonadota bacterium]
MSLGIGLSLGGVAARGRGTLGAPDWPEGAVALWLILGQSNAEGWAPWQQDPGKADPALAVPSLTVEERAAHPWLRMSTRGSGSNAGQFPTSSQGIATEAFPRSSGKVYSGAESRADGIPDGTQAFGAEIALVRHVREGTAPAGWRDDADPRLFLFKQAEGSKSVDYFRWGGDGQGLVLDALRQANGTNLQGLAAAKTVLIQGVIFVIGEKDAKDVAPTGETMAETLTPRFADWVRQLRGALGGDVPIAFCEVIENGAARAVSNARMAELAGALPNAAVIESQADWTDVGDATHYDAQGQDRLGRAAFGHLRDTYGRPGDGLVTAFPFTGLKPWFHVPPVFIDDGGSQMRVAATPSAPGVVHALSTAPGTPKPSAQAIYDARNGPDAFQRNVDAADVETVWYTGGGSFVANQTRDVHFMLRAS